MYKKQYISMKRGKIVMGSRFTSDCQFSGTLRPPQSIFCNNFVLSSVFRSNPQYQHRTDSTGVGDEIVSVGIQAYIVSEPCHVWHWVPPYGTAHVAFIAFRSSVHFQRNNEPGRTLKIADLSFWNLHSELFCKKGD